MPKTNIEKTVEEFDEIFPDSRGIFEGGDPYGSRRKAIKSFLTQSLTSQAQMMVEIFEKKLEEWEETAYVADDGYKIYVFIPWDLNKKKKDILTSYKERGLIK